MYIPIYSDLYRNDTSLRPYQQKAKKEIFDAWDNVDNVMFQMPTGTGKTRLFTSIISDINAYSIQQREAVKILIIAHRTELIDQIDGSLTKYKVPHNIIAGGRKKNYKYPVNIASIQTITNRNNIQDAKKLNVQFIIIDEAHHALAATYKKLWDMYPNSKKLGVTATPWRMNHQSFTDLFDQLVLSMPIKDFIKKGYLAPYKYFSLKNDSDIQKTIDGIELDRFGEYKEDSMEEKMDIGSIRAQLLDSYLSLAEGKKGIIYAINIVHAKHICEEYKNAGYKAVSIDSKTPAAERKELVDKFKRGLIDIIVNVDIFSEGFDCPDIEFIQLARPTRSLVKYLQQVGRGLRPTEDKYNCVILDNVGMYSRFGLPDARRHWKHHFLGKDVVEEISNGKTKSIGRHRIVDMSEGTEDMELIQDVGDDVEETVLNTLEAEMENTIEDYNPLTELQANNYTDGNFLFWFVGDSKIYEAYIHDDKNFIISELIIDKENHSVHRKRVGKIPMHTWMFQQLERNKVDQLKSVTHFGSYYTVFHFLVQGTNNTMEDKYFDYKGRVIDSPIVVKKKYEQAKREGQVNDFVDIPISKATFSSRISSNEITISRMLKGVVKPIAIFPVVSDFGKHYFYNAKPLKLMRKKMGLKRLSDHNSDVFYIYKSDDKSFSVKCNVNGIEYIYTYDLNGKQIEKGIVANIQNDNTTPLSKNDIEKLWHVFDKKATSYKYFWFLSILELYKEKQDASIPYKYILIRMASKAWQYVFLKNGRFSQSDQLPIYLRTIKSVLKMKDTEEESDVEDKIENGLLGYTYQMLNPLLKNVPYRFLSPWIPFTNNDDVKQKSQDRDSRCLYGLYDNHITIHEIWKEYLIEHYDEINIFIINGLKTHLNISHSDININDFYNKTYPSISRLVEAIRTEEGLMVAKPFFEKFDIPFTKDISPKDILRRIPDSRWKITSEGYKVVDVRDGKWSIKLLEELLTDKVDINVKMRFIGYYNREGQFMKPEEIFPEEAKELSNLLRKTFDTFLNNKFVDNKMKKVINGNTVFVLKGENDHLYGYYPKKNIVRITNVDYREPFVIPMPDVYKRWFYPGDIFTLFEA